MNKCFPLYVSLVHYPVIDKNGATVTTSVTLFDLHDIARSCVTFGASSFFIVNHAPRQQQVVQRVIDFWDTGFGKEYNSNRKEALDIVKTTNFWEESKEAVSKETGKNPIVIGTSARFHPDKEIRFQDTQLIMKEAPVLLLFGTGWGLSPDIIASVDYMLQPIEGPTPYNHLSVRSAVAIILYELTKKIS
ncbi:MAG: RNA methyltransferase [Caldisericia bacterium]|nr:RNA methyltransferase [Caldisericia bacterium]MDD4613897.1 RNA methyltransferase [Caldisericia bacterium]